MFVRRRGEISSVPGTEVLSREELSVWVSCPGFICICLFRWPKLLCECVKTLVGTWLTSSWPTSDQENKITSMGLEVDVKWWCHLDQHRKNPSRKTNCIQTVLTISENKTPFIPGGTCCFSETATAWDEEGWKQSWPKAAPA